MNRLSIRRKTTNNIETLIGKTRGTHWTGGSTAYAKAYIQACGKFFRRQYLNDRVNEFCERKAALQKEQRWHDRLVEKLQRAEEHLSQVPQGNWLWAMICLACAVIGLSAEYAFTYETLPFLLEIPKGDTLAFFVAAAPVTSVVMLDMVMWRLIEEPWRTARNANPQNRSAWGWIPLLVMGLFLVSIGAMLLYTTGLLAEIREEVQQFYHGSQGGGTLNSHLVNQTILWISIGVMLTSAWFLLHGILEYRQARQWSAAKRTVNKLRAQQLKCDEKLASAEAEWEAAQITARSLSGEADDLTDAYELARLWGLENSPQKPHSATAVVDAYYQSSPVITMDGPETEVESKDEKTTESNIV